MSDIIISDEKSFSKKKNDLIKSGFDNLHFVSDFDRTLTKAFVNSNFYPALISIFATEGYLSREFNNREKELFNYYHPYEISNSITLDEKKEKMEMWWDEMAQSLIDFSLNKGLFEEAAKSQKIQLRDKTKEVLEIINSKEVPFIIFSASGLGDISIKEVLKYKNLLFPNIDIISNKFLWDENGYAIDYEKPHIHPFNKKETTLSPDIKEKISKRKNIILLGDSLGDSNMAETNQTILKIGFLNYHIDEKIEEYKKHYDVVITNDGSMDFVYDLLKEIDE